VPVLTTGHDKARVTVMLTGRSDGSKLKPMVLLKRKRPDKKIEEEFGKKLHLVWAGRVWMDDELTAEYLNRVLGQSLFEKRLLIWDSFRCHISQSTKKKLRQLHIHTAIIPGGCTKFIQAPDVSWNAPFKARIRQFYDNWVATGDRMEYTESGNPKPPSMAAYLDWIHRAWDALPKELIAKSFKGN
jgi:hypothetical protein